MLCFLRSMGFVSALMVLLPLVAEAGPGIIKHSIWELCTVFSLACVWLLAT